MTEIQKKKMELLAPAGDWDAFLAGLAAGADAIYLGGKAFSARQSAANFDLTQLQEAADLLHLHGKKLYVTVNTLINDTEMENALDYLADLYNLGIDAVIVQDLGLIKLAREYLPNLELHASTQMTIHNCEGALLLKDLGIKRGVLARELTENEVKSIVDCSGLDIEIFVHGALCVCYSGQCLMSSMIGGRSGNRGRCAQPCRLEYQLLSNEKPMETEGSYLLSPKDLNLIELLPQINRAGVTSLKIEGRMKRPEYVYTVVKTYRKVLDRFYDSPEDFRIDPLEIQELEQTFNRGFTTGYFEGERNKALMSFGRPNNRGIFLGRVKSVDHRSKKIQVKLESELTVGDELEIWVTQGGRIAFTVNELSRNGQPVTSALPGETVELNAEGKISTGCRLFKIFSIRVQQETKQALDRENPELKVPCSALVTGKLSESLLLIYTDELGNEVEVKSSIPLQSAKNRPLTREALQEQLGRLGDTPFYLKKVESRLADGLMLPFSELNKLRREAIDELTRIRLSLFKNEPIYFKGININKSVQPKLLKTDPVSLSVWASSLDSVVEAVLAGADLVYAGGEELTGFRWEPESFRKAIAAAHEGGARLVAAMPRINREGQQSLWKPYLENLIDSGADGIIVSDLGALQIALNHRCHLPLYLNYPLNFFNQFSLDIFNDKQIYQMTLSPELTMSQIIALQKKSTVQLECLVQGPLELMVSEYCPVGSAGVKHENCSNNCCQNNQPNYYLRDRLKIDFPIYTDQFCRMHLLNSQDLCLYADLAKFTQLKPLTLRLELKTHSPQDTAMITNAYRFGLDRLAESNPLPDAEETIRGFKELTGRGITRGHYFRGVD